MMKVIYTIGIVAALLAHPAWANYSTPRQSYQTQVCHHSTAGIIKKSLRQESKSVDAFCGCLTNKVITRISQPEDHAYALAYHETNIVIERSQRYNQPMHEIAKEFAVRSAGYDKDLGISPQDLERHTGPAHSDILYCMKNTIPSLRGSFPS